MGDRLGEIDRLLAQTASTARAILEDLRPRALDEEGIATALQDLAARVEERSGLRCEVHWDGDTGVMPPALATALFRLVQEALTNTVRLARATRAECRVTHVPGRLTVWVRDNGIGIAERHPGDGSDAHGMGIIGMRERVLSLGGLVTIERAAAGGTEVRASFPLGVAPGGPEVSN